MKKPILILFVLLSFGIVAALMATTMRVEQQETHVEEPPDQAPPAALEAAIPAPPAQDPEDYPAPRNPRDLEGKITKVDYPESGILLVDIDGKEHRIFLKAGMINDYKTGDYVRITLTEDLRKAESIATKPAADMEGDIVMIDRAENRIVVKDTDGNETLVEIRPDADHRLKVGHTVRLYLLSGQPELGETTIARDAMIVRVR